MLRRPDLVGLVGLAAVQAADVGPCMHGDGGDTQLGGGAEDANGYLAAVGNEQLADGRGGLGHQGCDPTNTMAGAGIAARCRGKCSLS